MTSSTTGDDWASEYQDKVGKYFGTNSYVDVDAAHIVISADILGMAGVERLEVLAEQGVKFRVPTTTNVEAANVSCSLLLEQDKQLVTYQRRINVAVQSLGAVVTKSCVPYQSFIQPHYGQHVAWGDTGAVCYANSVFGARSNFEAGAAGLAAAITGRVPKFGFHNVAERMGTKYIDVEVEMADVAEWGALGIIVSRICNNYWEVPIVDGVDVSVQGCELKHFAAAVASYGSLGMFGIVGVTPEAQTLKQAFGGKVGKPELHVTKADITAVMNDVSVGEAGSKVDAVVFAAPQLSVFELQRIITCLDGRSRGKHTEIIIAVDPGVAGMANELGFLDILQQSGVIVLVGTCFYQIGLAKIQTTKKWTTIMTNSAKLLNTAGGYGFNILLRPTRECIESAISGKDHWKR